MLAAGELSPSQVGIVTPYSAQVRLLRQLWREACQEATAASKKGAPLEPGHDAAAAALAAACSDPRSLEIASVDNFQGREKVSKSPDPNPNPTTTPNPTPNPNPTTTPPKSSNPTPTPNLPLPLTLISPGAHHLLRGACQRARRRGLPLGLATSQRHADQGKARADRAGVRGDPAARRAVGRVAGLVTFSPSSNSNPNPNPNPIPNPIPNPSPNPNPSP